MDCFKSKLSVPYRKVKYNIGTAVEQLATWGQRGNRKVVTKDDICDITKGRKRTEFYKVAKADLTQSCRAREASIIDNIGQVNLSEPWTF